ncbi:hypothetical protein GCM10010129_57630 [Streptomyces fumigatiscleroticus]|nr:hypothetical protein GCM10010129_57630 [Streptomyces fumigatiscleroticus]
MCRPVSQLKAIRAVVEVLGVSQRTVERYVKDQFRRPRADLAPGWRMLCGPADSRASARRPAGRRRPSTGLVVATRVRFGCTAAPGTTDDARIRDLPFALPPRTTPPASSTQRRPARASGSCAASRPKPAARSASATRAASAHSLAEEFTGVERTEFGL